MMKFFKDLHNRFCSFRNKDIAEKNPLDVTSRKEKQAEKPEQKQTEEPEQEEKQEQEQADEEKQDLESEIDNLIKELEHDESTIYLETPE